MEGKYYEYKENERNSYFTRLVFHLDNGHKVCYDDSRCFGRLKLSNEENYLNEKEIKKLGPEPFDADPVEIYQKVNNWPSSIKSTLLDQTVMCGIGNIYADEILFANKLHPETETSSLSLQDWENIITSAKKILSEAISSGGSTIKSYHPGKDISGNFQVRLKAYGKVGQSCPNCGHTFTFKKVAGRGSTFCPNCQEKHAKKITIAVTGKVASGKSKVLKILAENNIPTISSDEIVSNLYKSKDVAKHIGEMFKLNFADEVDKSLLTKHLLANPKDLRKLEAYVHPLVKEEIAKFIKSVKKGIIAVEVPLLFEAKMQNDFDEVIAVDVTEDTQINRIKNRDNKNAKNQLTINKNNSVFDYYKHTAKYLINNNGSLEELTQSVKDIINKVKLRLN